MNWMKSKLAFGYEYVLKPVSFFSTFALIILEVFNSRSTDSWSLDFPGLKNVFIFMSKWALFTTIIILIVILFEKTLTFFVTKRIAKLENDLAAAQGQIDIVAANIETFMNSVLIRLVEKIGRSGDPNIRLTIYMKSKKERFRPFGRYSPNPELSKKNRQNIHLNEGCICKGWLNTEHYEGNFSRRKIADYSISADTFSKLRMKSKTYFVRRIDSLDNRPLAIIVLESLVKNDFDSQLVRISVKDEAALISEIICKLSDHFPDPDDDRAKGVFK